ncbi:MAG TPA: hypothetical protein VL096_07635, partial [Pirellulaceae bacterium]|nr:hypothetical protein [Pirellulaceae bacterium]
MDENNQDFLQLQLTGKASAISADAFVEVLQNILVALKDINREVSEFGSETVEWEIVSTSLNSPLQATIRGGGSRVDRRQDADKSIAAYVSGMQHLERSNTPPQFFTERSLQA